MKFNKVIAGCCLAFGIAATANAQHNGLINTSASPYAKMNSVDLGSVQWTDGFWADRMKVCSETMVPNMWRIYTDDEISHAFKNFKIAAGIDTGSHSGPSFHDGDFYKTLEAVAALYASTRNPSLLNMMDKAIAVIEKAQRKDGYIYTKAIIEQRKNGVDIQFQDKLSFEAYNFGHLMTAACVHHRATGKTNLLNIAVKATDYLYDFYKRVTPEQAGNAICPSHYMGIVEMYRTTKNTKYLELAKYLIDIKGGLKDGLVDNQDRLPFRQQTKTMGHAVRANYLMAGVADVYAETGDTSLLHTLHRLWNDVVQHKMYITGGCGSLYDGVSNDGTSYNPGDVQKVHQAYGRDYQLPNFTAHNETCANIGNVLWNWRMLMITGDAQYADVMELALYNSVLSGISLDGLNFLYTNPLAYSTKLPFQQRWSKERVPYIALSNCCPPNVVRTISEVSNYAYTLSDEGVWVNLYGGNQLSTSLKDGSPLSITQTTAYPWSGTVTFDIKNAPARELAFFLRIPGWADSATILVNGRRVTTGSTPGSYATLKRQWKKGDKIVLQLPMVAKLMEANPLVEENRNQVAVKRGPVVYCLESTDIPTDKSVFQVALPVASSFKQQPLQIEGTTIYTLEGKAELVPAGNWKNTLYKPVEKKAPVQIPVKLVPYFAWGNRGVNEMSVWLPASR